MFPEDNSIKKKNILVIPIKLREQLLKAAHESHPGITAMISRLRIKVWWPKIDKDGEML